MADTSQRDRDLLHPGHNPFDDPRPKRSKGLLIALVIAVIVHAALAVYLWKSKFEPTFKDYSEDVTDVAMVKPA
ncbi:MAG: energy transducer TonB, partial [Caulobacterales bacterium]